MSIDPQVAASVIAIVLGGLTLFRVGRKTVIALYERYIQPMLPITKLRGEMGELKDAVTAILSELRPNGGTTIKDAISRIEGRQVAHDERQLMSEQRYRALLSTFDKGTFEVDAAGDINWVSPSFCRICGKIPTDLLGSGWINAVHTDDKLMVRGEWNRAISNHRDLDISFLTNTTPPITVTMRTTKLLHDNEVLGYMGVLIHTEPEEP